jgi:hypothetical protein
MMNGAKGGFAAQTSIKEKRLDFELNQANATMNQNRGLQAEV